MVDLNTRNLSFIKAWHQLQDDDGLKNIDECSFMLTTVDENLVNFDINDLSEFDERKEIEYRQRIYDECKNNIWYFFREIVRVPDTMSKCTGEYCNAPMFTLTKETMDMIWCYLNGISFVNRYTSDNIKICAFLILLYDTYFNDSKSVFLDEEICNDQILLDLLICNAGIFSINVIDIYEGSDSISRLINHHKISEGFDNHISNNDERMFYFTNSIENALESSTVSKVINAESQIIVCNTTVAFMNLCGDSNLFHLLKFIIKNSEDILKEDIDMSKIYVI